MDDPVDSPLWWVQRLSNALDARESEVRKAENWYDGNHPIPEPPPQTWQRYDKEARIAFIEMARLGITNFMGPVVDMPASKLRIEGFRFGEGTATTDQQAWSIYQRNGLDLDSDVHNTTVLKTGSACALVWLDADDKAVITLEDPSQTIVAYVPGTRRQRAAGLKRWQDDTGKVFATLYLPAGIYKFETNGNLISAPPTGVFPSQTQVNAPYSTLILPQGVSRWRERTVAGEDWPIHNPLGKVPLVEFAVNMPQRRPLFGGGRPAFHAQITTQKRINNTMLNLLVTQEHQAFRQRWVVGWEPPRDKATGQVDKEEALKAGAATIMAFGGENVKVGEFSQADFAPFLAVIERDVETIATTSSTPHYAFALGDMVNVAADTIARVEGQFTSKVRILQRALGEGYEELIRLALELEGSVLADDMSSSILWAEAEERTAAEQILIAQAMLAMGAPREVAWAALPGVDQQEAHRWAQLVPETPKPPDPAAVEPPIGAPAAA